jgi:hypothetical protein
MTVKTLLELYIAEYYYIEEEMDFPLPGDGTNQGPEARRSTTRRRSPSQETKESLEPDGGRLSASRWIQLRQEEERSGPPKKTARRSRVSHNSDEDAALEKDSLHLTRTRVPSRKKSTSHEEEEGESDEFSSRYCDIHVPLSPPAGEGDKTPEKKASSKAQDSGQLNVSKGGQP